MVYKTKVDLTDIKIQTINNSKTWIYILLGIIGGIFLILAIFFIVRNIRLKNRNADLQNEIKSIEFFNDMQKNILTRNNSITKREHDYETTFI